MRLSQALWQGLRRQRQKARRAKLLRHVDTAGAGLEIGPSHAPVAPKAAGFAVKVMDHAPAEVLRQKYLGHGVNLDAIEEVDYIWSGQPFVDLVGDARFAWIVASHVIEHAPDLVGFFNDCESVLAERGVLSLAIPDMRYCFDHFRERSSLAQAIDAHRQARVVHSVGSVVDYTLNATTKGRRIGWPKFYPGRYRPMHRLADAKAAMQSAQEDVYRDVHGWCFTPASFRLMVADLYQLGLIGLVEIDFCRTTGSEFYITLGRAPLQPPLTRAALLALKAREHHG